MSPSPIKSLTDERPCQLSGMCQIMAALSLFPLLAADQFSWKDGRAPRGIQVRGLQQEMFLFRGLKSVHSTINPDEDAEEQKRRRVEPRGLTSPSPRRSRAAVPQPRRRCHQVQRGNGRKVHLGAQQEVRKCFLSQFCLTFPQERRAGCVWPGIKLKLFLHCQQIKAPKAVPLLRRGVSCIAKARDGRAASEPWRLEVSTHQASSANAEINATPIPGAEQSVKLGRLRSGVMKTTTHG